VNGGAMRPPLASGSGQGWRRPERGNRTLKGYARKMAANARANGDSFF